MPIKHQIFLGGCLVSGLPAWGEIYFYLQRLASYCVHTGHYQNITN